MSEILKDILKSPEYRELMNTLKEFNTNELEAYKKSLIREVMEDDTSLAVYTIEIIESILKDRSL